MNRGDVFMADFEPRSGAEQRGWRPCIVVMHSAFLEVETWFSVVVVPVSSSQGQTRRGPSVIVIDGKHTGLTKPSVALCHQITTLDKRKFGSQIGALSNEQLLNLEAGLRHTLELL
jgi:mRNA interferase MazF